MNSKVVHPWRVVLRHPDEVGRLTGTFTYNGLLKGYHDELLTARIAQKRKKYEL